MKKLYSLSTVLLLSLSCFAQPQAPDTLWTRIYGDYHYDEGECVELTSDDGFVIAGSTASFGAGYADVYLIKTDNNGYQQWYQTFGGPHFDYGYSVQQTTDGGFILAGYSNSFSIGEEDVYLIKTDSLGNLEWYRIFGGNSPDYGYCVKQTSDGGFIIVGKNESFGEGGGDVYLIKTDQLGNQLWYRTYGGVDNDCGESVLQTQDGGFVIAGGTGSYGAGECDVYLIKTDSLGNQLWYQTLGYVRNDYAHSIQQTSDDGFIIVGNSNSYLGTDEDVYLVKTDSLGNQQWFETYGGVSTDRGFSVRQTIDGGYIIAGDTYSYGAGSYDIYVIKTDNLGGQQWDCTYGGNNGDYGRDVHQLADGGFIIAGYSYSFCDLHDDVYLIRLDAEGALVENIGDNRPNNFTLYPLYPNPFNSAVTISFDLKSAEDVKLSVYDVTGKEVSTFDTGHWTIGKNSVVWDASAQASGIYFIRLEAMDYIQTQKIVLLK